MSKTCGECRFHYKDDHCGFVGFTRPADLSACRNFEPKPTNGDKIRQMSNEELAAVMCGLLNSRDEGVFEAILNYLNAPADCVKQNGNHDTQADLWKVDNTQSEGMEDK